MGNHWLNTSERKTLEQTYPVNSKIRTVSVWCTGYKYCDCIVVGHYKHSFYGKPESLFIIAQNEQGVRYLVSPKPIDGFHVLVKNFDMLLNGL